MNLKECLENQVAEVELLENMFPSDQEFVLDDPATLSNALSCVNGEIPASEITSTISYTIKLRIDPKEIDMLEFNIDLSPTYPHVKPDFMLRSRELSNTSVKRLSAELHEFLKSNFEPGQLCITQMIYWLQENAERIYDVSFACGGTLKSKLDTSEEQTSSTISKIEFRRLWLYSHHIYSKIKRKVILETAKDLSLSGFSLPGKPGIICVEGERSATEEFWHVIRRMTWKRICVKYEENSVSESHQHIDHERKFIGFEEKCFIGANSPANDKHMDFGVLFNFLNEAGLGHVFQVYFGVEGKNSS